MNDTSVFEFFLFGIFGLGVGSLHFAALWWNIKAYASPTHHYRALLLQGLRPLMTGALFVWVAAVGAFPLLAALGGFSLARPLVTRIVVRLP